MQIIKYLNTLKKNIIECRFKKYFSPPGECTLKTEFHIEQTMCVKLLVYIPYRPYAYQNIVCSDPLYPSLNQ